VSLDHHYTGLQRYCSRATVRAHRLLVAVRCCLGDLVAEDTALLDTAAEWCVLSAELLERLGGVEEVEGPPVRLSTRLGSFTGDLVRIPVRFSAEFGQALTVEATWICCADWPGPLVLGWTGCLERFRFALDPETETFYFG
jgi:hypothetical protein